MVRSRARRQVIGRRTADVAGGTRPCGRSAEPPVPPTAIRTLACSQHQRALGERGHPPWMTSHSHARTPSRSTVEPRGLRTGCWTSPRTLLPSPRVGQAGDVRTSPLPRGGRPRHPDDREPTVRSSCPADASGGARTQLPSTTGPGTCRRAARRRRAGSRPGNSSHPGEPRGREPRHARSTFDRRGVQELGLPRLIPRLPSAPALEPRA
jgi:hypothetical protein